jgi:hypothetical protein
MNWSSLGLHLNADHYEFVQWDCGLNAKQNDQCKIQLVNLKERRSSYFKFWVCSLEWK